MKIEFRHYRIEKNQTGLRRYFRGHTSWSPTERGGLTECCVISEDGRVIAIGEALCSASDAFCYNLGRKISKGRALAQLGDKK